MSRTVLELQEMSFTNVIDLCLSICCTDGSGHFPDICVVVWSFCKDVCVVVVFLAWPLPHDVFQPVSDPFNEGTLCSLWGQLSAADAGATLFTSQQTDTSSTLSVGSHTRPLSGGRELTFLQGYRQEYKTWRAASDSFHLLITLRGSKKIPEVKVTYLSYKNSRFFFYVFSVNKYIISTVVILKSGQRRD